MNIEEKQLIDRYLQNKLTGFELKSFHDRMESDSNFRKKISFHNLLIECIQESENKRVNSSIQNYIGYKKPAVPFALKLIVTFFIVTLSGIVLWNYLGPSSTGNKHNYFSLDFLKKKKGLESNQVPVESKEDSEISSNQVKIAPAKNTVDGFDEHYENPSADTNNLYTENGEDIVVKKDQMLVSIYLKPIAMEIDSLGKNDTNIAGTKTVSDMLNPSADLPEDNVSKSENYLVEFWVSPVNYTGYKLSENRLILFGIEEPDAVELYSGKNKMWMKYDHKFYNLERNDQFVSLRLSSDIPIQKR
jgi:hypothetical protein